MKNRNLAATIAFGLALLIGGCAALDDKLFAKVETGAQRALRAVFIYTEEAVEFAEHDLEALDQAAYDAVLAMKAAADTGGDVGAAAKPARKALRKYAARSGVDFGVATIFGDPSIPAIAKKLVKEGGSIAAAVLRIRKKVSDIVEAGRDPTPDEWAEALMAAAAIHTRIQE